MQKEKFIIIPNNKEFKLYEKYNLNTFILPLKDYSIGYEIDFDIDEINELSKQYNIYVMMNKFLHKSIYDFENIYPKFNKNIKFIIEDIGLVNIIDKDRLVLYENHILSNYKAINFLRDIGINNVVINNDLTIRELKEIEEKTNSNIYYFYTSKNMIMYSKRNLVKNYNEYFNIDGDNEYVLREHLSNKVLEINDYKDGSVVRYNKIFCASKYLKELNNFNLIIDFNYLNDLTIKMILENINEENLCNLIDSDYYFLENDIKYKVGDLK